MRNIIWTLWAIYLAVLALMMSLVDLAWLTPLEHYRQTLVWLTTEASQARIGGLMAAGRVHDAVAYMRLSELSLALLLLATLAGVTKALSTTNPMPLRPRETKYVLGFFALMTYSSPATSAWLASLSETYPQPLYTATPAYWLVTMVLSAILIARYSAYGAHDIVLVMRSRWRDHQPGMTAAE